MTLTRSIPLDPSASAKPKRVRTGCLTCRRRHLKCDEGVPNCLNCRKSNRTCERGIRLNFLDVQLHAIPYRPAGGNWAVEFKDESLDIASEYKGGLQQYARHTKGSEAGSLVKTLREQPVPKQHAKDSAVMPKPQRERVNQESNSRSELDEIKCGDDSGNIEASYFIAPDYEDLGLVLAYRDQRVVHELSMADLGDQLEQHDLDSSNLGMISQVSRGNSSGCESPYEIYFSHAPPSSLYYSSIHGRPRAYSASFGEVLYLQVYVDEVGAWMDLMNHDKHFSQLIPYKALQSTVLLNALLACGARQLSFKAPELREKAVHYYNTAVNNLLRSIQDVEQDLSERATAAVILYAYEIMSARSPECMNDVTAPRALFQQCGWNGQSTGAAGACFWLNNWVEVLKCLAFRFNIAGEPYEWPSKGRAITMGEDVVEQEDVWVRRILNILAAIANFRASKQRSSSGFMIQDRLWIGERLLEWQGLKRLCDDWDESCPKTMHPKVYLKPSETGFKTCFPCTWLLSRSAILGRLFYHTAQCILAQTYPYEPVHAEEEMRSMQIHHAHEVCGIVAYTQECGIAAVAVRTLTIAAAVLTERAEQTEVLDILDKMGSRSGWYLRFHYVKEDLMREWGWGR